MRISILTYSSSIIVCILIWLQGMEQTWQTMLGIILASLMIITKINKVPKSISTLNLLGIGWIICLIIRLFISGIVDVQTFLETILFYAIIPVFFLFGYSNFLTNETFEKHIKTVLLSIALMIIISSVLYIIGYKKLLFTPIYPWDGLWQGYISGVFSYKNHFGYFSLILFLLVINDLKSNSILIFFLLTASIIGIIISDSRLSLLGMFISILFTFHHKISINSYKYTPWILLICLIIISNSTEFLDDNGRILLYQYGINALSENWLEGMGLMEYQTSYYLYLDERWGSSEKAKYAHNGFLQILINQGVLQGGILISIILYPLIYIAKRYKKQTHMKKFIIYYCISIMYICLDYILYLPIFLGIYFYIFGLFVRFQEDSFN
jgi:hypothetical protein